MLLFLKKLWIEYQAALIFSCVVVLHIIVWFFFLNHYNVQRTSPRTSSSSVFFFNAVYHRALRQKKVAERPRQDIKQSLSSKQLRTAGVSLGRSPRSEPEAAGVLPPQSVADNGAVHSFAANPSEVIVESDSQFGLSVTSAERIEWARKNAGKIDRGMRSGIAVSLPVTKSRFDRLSDDFSSAHVSRDDEVDRRFVSPEGIIYYSTTIRGKTTCYMSGPVSSPNGVSKGPGAISCPSSAGKWAKY